MTLFHQTLTFPRTKRQNECHHWIHRHKWSIKHVWHDNYAAFFSLWTWLTWPWPLHLCSIRSTLTFYLRRPLWSLLAKFLLATGVSPVSVSDKVKGDNFDNWPDVDLSCILFNMFSLKSILWELSIAASPSSLRLLVREVAKVWWGVFSPTQHVAFDCRLQRCTGLNNMA